MDTRKYKVKYTCNNFPPDANWNKNEWRDIESISITNKLLIEPLFTPTTKIKLLYNKDYIYVIFKVEDKYIRSVYTEINSPVSKDSCVEFFFTPSNSKVTGYFNLETNAGGTRLIRFQKGYNIEKIMMDIEDIKSIEIAHSLPEIVKPEILTETTWTLEYRIPLKMLKSYSEITQPTKGVIWRANFYKTAGENSNPHYLSWNKIIHPDPNFHLPEFFGELEFL